MPETPNRCGNIKASEQARVTPLRFGRGRD
jgi:hypothetical protein